MNVRTSVVAVLLMVAAVLVAQVTPARAVDQPAGSLVGERPAPFTPHVLDGRVYAITQVGNTVLLGGTFSTARNSDSQNELSRSRLLAFNATTGEISTSFTPNPNGTVNAIVPAGDGASVYVGGSFTSIGGVSRSRVARVRVSDGAVLGGFDAGWINGQVKDLRLVDDRLWLAGTFGSVGGTNQRALATVDATTGAFDPFMRLPFAGIQAGGSTNVQKIDVTPDGDRLVAVGNFSSVANTTNNQLAMLDIDGGSATLANWRSSYYAAPCVPVFYTYMRDVDFSPDGSYFVVGTTGAYQGADSPCDTVARFETNATGNDVAPSWIDHSGGDTTYSVEATDSAVYVGGHQRWWNNPFEGDDPGPGAVRRDGIAALDPINGLPLSWNPGRTRGVGVFDFMLTPQGLWFTSDTDRVGAWYLRSRVALMPAGGATIPAIRSLSLPGYVYVGGQDNRSTLTSRSLTAAGSVGAGTDVPTGGIDWDDVRGAFVINGQLYLAHADGSFTRRSFNGSGYGNPVAVNTQDQIVTLTDWRNDISDATGMFYDGGRIYFTRSGSSQLFYRYFTPESGVVGAARYVASNGVNGIDFGQVRGMFHTGDRLYWATPTGALNRINWQPPTANRGWTGIPVGGTAAQVSGPGVDGLDWSGRALFLSQSGEEGTPEPGNTAPDASFTASCAELTCSFDASASSDPDDDSLSYAWDFGDGSTGSGETATRTYDSGGQRTVTLTVSDGSLTDSTTRQVTVATTVTGDVTFVGADATRGNRRSHRVTIPGSVQAGDTLLLFMTTNNTNSTINDPQGWSPVEAVDGRGVRGRAYTRTATADDAGGRVLVTTSGYAKSTLSVSAYRVSDGGAEVTASAAGLVNDGPVSSFTSPTVPVSTDGSWYIGYWAEKSSDVPEWDAPNALTVRTTVAGSGGGKISSILTDTGGPVTGGSTGGFTATTEPDVARGVMFSIVVGPDA